MKKPQQPLKLTEFVTLLAMMISILALSIDAMLPALGDIRRDLRIENPNDVQLVISAMFLGFAIGQIAAGPLSDSFGRKPVIYFGYAVFITGCIFSIFSTNFEVMLIGRVLQGLGAAFPRIVSLALVRDGYEGREMARIMSIVMAIFILVPTFAPAIGQGILLISSWRAIFVLLLFMAVIAFTWFALRQPETLEQENRRKFSIRNIASGIVEALQYRAVTGYMITSGFIFAALLGFLSSAQQVFQDVYSTGQMFVVYFGIAAAGIGIASIINSKLVIKYGMRYMTWRALGVFAVASFLFFAFSLMAEGIPPFAMFMIWLLITFFCLGMLFGNLNAMAMEPLGHMAGLGAAVIGSLSTAISLPLGWAIGALFDGTVLPMAGGFMLLGIMSLGFMWWTENGPAKV